MVSLKNDMNPAALKELCVKIDMPASVTEKVIGYAETYDFTAAEEFYPGLFSLETGSASVDGLKACFGEDDPDSLLMLTVMLAAALKTGRTYAEKGMPEKVWVDTMACFSRFVKEDQVSYGKDCFTRAFWAYRQLAMTLFRIGTMEYEMVPLHGAPVDLPELKAELGEPALSLHIPSDADLSRESLDATYAEAKAFFAKFYPEYKYRCAWCGSWIISPKLRDVLPENSRILIFQSDFIFTHIREESDSYKHWVYKNPDLEPKDFPEDTSLQRRLKAYVLAGNNPGSAEGILRPEIL